MTPALRQVGDRGRGVGQGVFGGDVDADGARYSYLHKNSSVLVGATVAPAKGCALRVDVQVLYQGRWVTTGQEYFQVNSAGRLTVRLDGPGQSGIKARVRMAYVPDAGGEHLNRSTYGGWNYLYFTK